MSIAVDRDVKNQTNQINQSSGAISLIGIHCVDENSVDLDQLSSDEAS